MRAILGIVMGVTLLMVGGCSKQPLTLDENTSLKALLSASDQEITELVMKEVVEKMDMSAEDVSIEYILRDKDSQALAVKVKINESSGKTAESLGDSVVEIDEAVDEIGDKINSIGDEIKKGFSEMFKGF